MSTSFKYASYSPKGIVGGAWEFTETFKYKKVTVQEEVVGEGEKTISMVFDKFVQISPKDVVQHFNYKASDKKCETKFGTTRINWWFNSNFPLVGVCRYQDNEVSCKDKALNSIWSIGRMAYPIFDFTSEDANDSIFSNNELTKNATKKMSTMNLEDDKFSLIWRHGPYQEVTTEDWLKKVETWTTIHNGSIHTDAYKKSADFINSIKGAYAMTEFYSILHTLTKGQIKNLASLFFTI